VFTARYGLIPYTRQITVVFKGLMNSCCGICNLSEKYDPQFEVIQRYLLELLDPKEESTTNFQKVGNYLHDSVFRTIWIFHLKCNLLCSPLLLRTAS